MKYKKTNNDTVKYIILVVISVGFGTCTNNILENIEMNIWFARTIGALVTVIVSLLLNHLLIKKIETKISS